ncbi:MAG: cytochrome c oxidase assembly factor 1 family protein [Verrucomicrobiaceae bacterium]|nr:cytochrome c oxidase assembly factor 1 family protein [Verrucomicrobiaceae bacterium]
MSHEPGDKTFGDPTIARTENRAAIGKGVLIGCGGCAIIVTGIAAVFAVIFFSVFAAIGSSDAVAEAIKRASASPKVREQLGTPLTRGWFTSGNIETANGSSSADVRIPVKGPKLNGYIHAVGYKRGEEGWVFTVLEVTVSGSGERIDLLQTIAM